MNFVNLYSLSFTLHYLTIWLYMFAVFYQSIIALICSLKDRSILNSLKKFEFYNINRDNYWHGKHFLLITDNWHSANLNEMTRILTLQIRRKNEFIFCYMYNFWNCLFNIFTFRR